MAISTFCFTFASCKDSHKEKIMGYNIKFSVHRNPQKDADGNDTYQVRHETSATVSQKHLLNQLERHNIMRPELKRGQRRCWSNKNLIRWRKCHLIYFIWKFTK